MLSTPAVVLVAKFPATGTSKTRLSAEIRGGAKAAADISRAMILDLIYRLECWLLDSKKKSTNCSDASDKQKRFSTTELVLLYAPDTEDAMIGFEDIVKSAISEQEENRISWKLIPMRSGNNSSLNSLTSSNMSAKLTSALVDIPQRPLVFIGSDCPHLPMNEIENSICAADSASSYSKDVIGGNDNSESVSRNRSMICPAVDGGYVLLSLPSTCPLEVFDNVEWSTENTCTSQIAALKKAGLEVIVGDKAYRDIDELEDIQSIASTIASNDDSKGMNQELAHFQTVLNKYEVLKSE